MSLCAYAHHGAEMLDDKLRAKGDDCREAVKPSRDSMLNQRRNLQEWFFQSFIRDERFRRRRIALSNSTKGDDATKLIS